jgi:hypothetical protein
MRLMVEIDELEEGVEELRQKLRVSSGLSDSQDEGAAARELGELLGRLEQKRNELTRISNACRRPHSKG